MFNKKLLSATLVTFSILSVNSLALGDSLKATAKITSLKSSVQLKYHSSLWRNASINQLVRPGTSIRTGQNSKAQIIYDDGTITNIGSRTTLTVLDKESREIRISSGNLWYKVTKKSHGLKIYAPSAIASIIGTEGGVKVDEVAVKNDKKMVLSKNKNKNAPNANVTIVVAEGIVSVAMNNKEYSMTAGDRVSYSTLSPTIVDFKNIGVEKVKSLFESSKQDSIASNISNYVAAPLSMANAAALKANMTIIQNMLMTYESDNGGYPKDINDLLVEAKNKGFSKSIKNPFSNREGVGENGSVINYSTGDITSAKKGLVLYETSKCSQDAATNKQICSSYKLYSTDLNGKFLEANGQVYMLSNE